MPKNAVPTTIFGPREVRALAGGAEEQQKVELGARSKGFLRTGDPGYLACQRA
jgi:hypothetical protein